MQKIVFVSIILIIGLFSLQSNLFEVSAKYYINTEAEKQDLIHPASITTQEEIPVICVIPEDSLFRDSSVRNKVLIKL